MQHSFAKSQLYKFFMSSQTNKVIFEIQASLRDNFMGGFPDNVHEANNDETVNILETSVLTVRLIRLLNGCRYKIIVFFQKSAAYGLIKDLNKNLYFFPIKTVSLIIIISIATNTILSFILCKEISISGWFIRSVFLLIAFNGLLSVTSWDELSKTSYSLKYLNKSISSKAKNE